MKGFQLTSGIILITICLFSLQTQLVSAAFTMNETCNYIVKGWIADPSSCQGWGYCSGGILQGTGKCNPGLLFDTTTGSCNNANAVTCYSTIADVCKNVVNPQLVSDPDNCNNACYCDGNGNYECQPCGQNQAFNPATSSCVWSSKYSCPADNICRLVPNNMFAGDPYACGNYISCVNGAGFSQPCANGQYYNALTGNCQNADPCNANGNNPGSTPNAGLGVLTPLPTDVTKCSKSTGTVAKPQFIGDGKTCMGYYKCTSNKGPGTWDKCILGTHFNPVTAQCVTPYTYNCPYDRCANINQPFVTQVSVTDTTCSSYLYCKTQTTQLAGGGKCPLPDYPFFDEVIGACIKTKPVYAICGDRKSVV